MLGRVGDVHGHATRSASRGMFLSTRDHRSVGYRVPKEWAALTEEQRGVGSLVAFKRGSRGGSWRVTGPSSVGWWAAGSVWGGGEGRNPDVGRSCCGAWLGIVSTDLR